MKRSGSKGVILISAVILALSLVVTSHAYTSVSVSLLAFILPIVNVIWLIVLFSFALWKMSHQERGVMYQSLILPVVYLLCTLLIWPPMWVLRTSPDLDSSVSYLKHQQVISLMTYNVQRLGDLSPRTKRREVRAERLECIHRLVKESETNIGHPVELFGFQEVNNDNLKRLEEKLNLNCQHVGYHSQKTDVSGLGICIHRSSQWKINYVRNIILKGRGRWRALFAEMSYRDDPKTTFNLLNVHFLPHRIGTQEIKAVISSPETLLEVMKGIIKTSNLQREQAAGLLSLIKTYRDPTIMVGDFNAPPHAGAHALLTEQWRDVWSAVGTTFGATKYFGTFIPFRVDFIYALHDAFILMEARVPSASCSDHRPIISTLGLPKSIDAE